MRLEPCLARPVPFCAYGFLPPPLTSDLVFLDLENKYSEAVREEFLVAYLARFGADSSTSSKGAADGHGEGGYEVPAKDRPLIEKAREALERLRAKKAGG